MKTLQELYSEIIASDELKAAFAEAAKDGKAAEFLKAHGCEATAEELAAFLKSRSNGEISDEELDSVAGGCSETTGKEAAMSVATGGIACAVIAVISSSTDIEKGGRLC
ncbi:MAG: hypothetical protein ILP09_04265 [Oscillospiraceae bacterium]|nr:hypothetical protein [Oscillospiraceae bacterium]